MQAARALAGAGRWEEAASAYADIADLPGLTESARQHALAAAGDALRRDDRPAAAARLLTRALRVDPDGEAAGVLRVQLAGVLQQAGQLDVAADIACEGLERAADPMQAALARDTLIGTLHALGRLEEADRILDALERSAPEPFLPAVWFRRATRLRMAGRLSEAAERYAAAAQAMAAHPGAAAAAIMDLAEVALFEGEPERAGARYAQASRLWTAAGRRSGLYRAEAGLLRVELSAGRSVLPSAMGGPIDFARSRQLPLLLAHLLLARGAAARSEADLSEAVALAEESGAVLLEGRARLVQSRCGLAHDAERIAALLAPDAAWMAVTRGAPMPW